MAESLDTILKVTRRPADGRTGDGVKRIVMVRVMGTKLHVAHPVYRDRALCGRRDDGHLIDAEAYRHTSRHRRCRKCAQRLYLTWRIPAFRRSVRQAPNYQYRFEW